MQSAAAQCTPERVLIRQLPKVFDQADASKSPLHLVSRFRTPFWTQAVAVPRFG